MELPQEIEKLSMMLKKLPGVGPKGALRFVLAMAGWKKSFLEELALGIKNLSDLNFCKQCYMYAQANESLCSVCKHPQRSLEKTLCLVENVVDFMAIERSAHYHGLFHILSGLINPILGIGPEDLTMEHFLERLQSGHFENIILALPPTVEGDITCSYIRDHIPTSIKVERLGLGIPMGGHLDYLDSLTILKALENRKILL